MGSARTRAAGPAGTVIELLEREWAVLVGSAAAAAALRRWGSEDKTLAQFRTMGELVAYVECRSVNILARDEVLGSLGTRAGTDETAARTLLQLLLPGAKALVARYRWSAESVDELAAAVVADIYDRLRALPSCARRRCLAPAILGDARKRLQRRTARARRQELRLDDLDAGDAPAPEHERAAAAELAEVLRWAVAHGHLSARDAELICLTRVAEVPVARISAMSGEDPQTIRQRRLRAERALRAAVPAA